MSNLLIHSMSEFSALILDCLQKAGAREIVEVGAEFGGMSQHLANHAAAAGGRLTSIDPAPKQEFLDWVAASPQVRHLASPSLDAMPTLSGVDAWVIDGDHNYHTVSNELAIAAEQSVRDDKPLLLFLHDVGWPCGRRDFCYAPDRIPATARHPHSFDDGVVPGNPGLVRGGGFRGVGQFAVAEREGGPANGVLTAVEDFIDDLRDEGREIGFAFVPAVFGLGVVFASDQPWSADVAALLHPFHDNPLLARMEENRLLNYVTVIGWEDLTARRAGAPRIAA